MTYCGVLWGGGGFWVTPRFDGDRDTPLTSWRFRTSVCPEIQAQGAQDAR